MANYNEMTSKQLKELGKENHVKNWWNLSKAALIAALSEIDNNANDREPEPEIVEIQETIEVDTLPAADPELPAEEPKKIKKPNLKIHELTYDGRTQSIRKWAEELEMPWPTLYDRVNRNGWTVEDALTIPLGGRRKK